MEHLARREPLRHPAIERLDQRKIQALAQAGQSKTSRERGGSHDPWEATHFRGRQSIHLEARIGGVEAGQMAEAFHLAREIEGVKPADAANTDLHDAGVACRSVRSRAGTWLPRATPLNSKMRSSAGSKTRS